MWRSNAGSTLHPPTVEFVSCDRTERGTKRLYPQGFHSTPCICMRYNRKAYTERGGPHGDWRLLDWRLPSGNGVDNVIAVIAKIHIAATVNFEFIEVVLHPAEDLEYTPASCSRVVLSATSKSRYQLGSTNSGSLGYRPRYCMWSLRTHGIPPFPLGRFLFHLDQLCKLCVTGRHRRLQNLRTLWLSTRKLL